MNIKIGEILKRERENRGLSQNQVAEATQINRATISLYENDEREISLVNLKKFATYYGKSILDFLKNEDDEILTVSYRANKFSKEDLEKIEWAKKFTINLYEMKNLLNS